MMMLNTLLPLLFLTTPTNMLTLYSGLGLLKREATAVQLLSWSLLLAVALHLYRLIPPFGMHMPLFVVTLVLVFRYLGRSGWPKSILVALVPMLLTVIAEGLISVPIIHGVLGIPLAEGLTNPWITIAGGWLSNALLLILACSVWLRNRSARPAHQHS